MTRIRLACASTALALVMSLAPPPTGGMAQAAEADAAPDTIGRIVERYRSAVAVPGVAVAVTRGSSIVHVSGYGRTVDGRPVTEHTTMATASVSKSFTALAVMRLVDDGTLNLDDPVQEHLPGFGMDDPWAAKITVGHLLNQTSGLTDRTVPQFTREQPDDLAGSVADFRGRTLATGPGRTFAYYNPNYQIAARIVEVATGQPFSDYLRQHVFEPLGMADSRAIATAADLPASAGGHLRLFGRAIRAPEPPAFGAGSGGVLSSADDLAAWLIMQANNGALPDGTQLASANAIQAMRTPTAASRGYGLGWRIGTTPGGAALVDHTGDLFTSTAYQALLPETGHGIAVLANTGMAYGDAEEIGRRIIAAVDSGRGGGGEPPADPLLPVDVGLAGGCLLALILIATGIRRSAAWAGRRRNWPTVIARTAPLALPAVLFSAMAPIVRALYRGRDVDWLQVVYLYPSFMLALALVAAASSALAISRIIRYLRRGSAGRSGRAG